MKKLLILLTFLVIFTSCETPTFKDDPEMKESERIAVLEKVKTDTTTVVVEMDKYLYTVKNNKIVARAYKTDDDTIIWPILIIALIFGICIGAGVRD